MKHLIARFAVAATLGAGVASAGISSATALTCLAGSGTTVGNPALGATIGTFEALGITPGDGTGGTVCIGNEVWAPPSGFTLGSYIKGAETSGRTLNTAVLDVYVVEGVDFPGYANALDHRWVQDNGNPTTFPGDIAGGRPSEGIVWDLGGPANKAVVFVMVDHPPLPGEVLENSVWLSNDPNAADGAWTLAVLKEVHGGGFDPDPAITDGFVAVYELPGGATFRYVSVTWGGPGAALRDGDNEIDAVGGLAVDGGGLGVPAPMSALLLGGALAGLGTLRRRR